MVFDSLWERIASSWRLPPDIMGEIHFWGEIQMNNIFTSLPKFLRDPDQFFEEVRDNQQVGKKAMTFAIAAFLFLAAYGFTVGLAKSPLQAISSAIKMPVLFLSTVAFCLPALYFFSLALLGTPLRIIQVLTIVLSRIAVTAFLLLGLAPITLFFVLTSTNYPFFQLLAVIFVGISAVIGVYFLWRGMTLIEPSRQGALRLLGKRILGLWMLLFGFVGTQMTWRLSPFIGKPEDPFYILKPARDNFYVQAITAFQQTLQLPAFHVHPEPFIEAGVCAAASIGFLLLLWAIFGALARKRNQDLPLAQEAHRTQN